MITSLKRTDEIIHRHARGWFSTADVDLRTPLASSLVQNTTNSNNARNVFPSSLLSNLRLREIRRPYTCFCEWFSIVPYSNVEKKKIKQFYNYTDFHTLFPHLHCFYHTRIIRICRLRQCRHTTPVQTWVPKSVVPWTASQLLTRTLNYDHDVETYRWSQIHRHARGWLSTADVDQRTPLAALCWKNWCQLRFLRHWCSPRPIQTMREKSYLWYGVPR